MEGKLHRAGRAGQRGEERRVRVPRFPLRCEEAFSDGSRTDPFVVLVFLDPAQPRPGEFVIRSARDGVEAKIALEKMSCTHTSARPPPTCCKALWFVCSMVHAGTHMWHSESGCARQAADAAQQWKRRVEAGEALIRTRMRRSDERRYLTRANLK